MPSFNPEAAVPCESIYMFSAIDESEEAAELNSLAVDDVDELLPHPAGKSGGPCASAFLQTLWQDEYTYSWAQTLEAMHEKLQELGLDTVLPQLSTSRAVPVDDEICIVSPENDEEDEEGGVKRALLVGINYTGQENALSSCHDDVRNMKQFLMQFYGVERKNMMILMDDGNHHEPNKHLILTGLKRVCEISKPGDSIFVQFSGHGGQTPDQAKVLIPGDFKHSGLITDRELYTEFLSQVPPGVHVVVMIDCCHSGTVMDLPYVCGPGEEEVHHNEGFGAVAGAVANTKGGKKNKSKAGKGKKQEKEKDKEKKGKANKKAAVADAPAKKSNKKGKKKKQEVAEEVEEEDGGEAGEEEHVEVERPEPKKKKGLLGVFSRKKK